MKMWYFHYVGLQAVLSLNCFPSELFCGWPVWRQCRDWQACVLKMDKNMDKTLIYMVIVSCTSWIFKWCPWVENVLRCLELTFVFNYHFQNSSNGSLLLSLSKPYRYQWLESFVWSFLLRRLSAIYVSGYTGKWR